MIRFSPERVTVLQRRHLSDDCCSLVFGPCSRADRCRPGQFLHLRIPESRVYFRRAMSLASVDPDSGAIEVIFKVVGVGTRALSACQKGAELDIINPLGNGFTNPGKSETILLVAGGVGFPPLFYFATELIRQGRDPKSIEFFYGGRTANDLVERGRIKKLGVRFHPVTDDGSFGEKGMVTDAVDRFLAAYSGKKLRLYGCGPEPMLRAADDLALARGIPGQLSLEAPMPCGIGVCLGCIVTLRNGEHARVCHDGPVFDIGEVLL
jgi:dihydroorotate dehydrogenase electron transfer subunit